MNLTKYIDKTFPAGKTAKELNLDTSRKFVVVEAGHPKFDVGTVLHFFACEESMCPIFVADDKTKHARPVGLSYLAYLEEEDEVKKVNYHKSLQDWYGHAVAEWLVNYTKNKGAINEEKNYTPRVGDKVRLEGVVASEFGPHPLFDEDCIEVRLNGKSTYSIRESDFDECATLISRAPRKLTKEEATKLLSEKLGESVEIV